MIEFGHFASLLAFVMASMQAVTGLNGQRKVTSQLAILAFGAQGFAFLTLILAFAASDFSVELVATNSNTLKPMLYKIAGTWGNHEGSMALWCLVTLTFGAAAALWLKTDDDKLAARAIGIQGLVAAGSLAYLLFASSPFPRLDPAPLQGAGLNPILQDPALAIHPPMLYIGYVGFSFVFALAGAGLINGKIDRHWASIARPWALAAFVPLTLGIGLGSYWAYYELGWGGWWFWDPVENASFMPWLIGAALIHSIIVTEKRGGFAAWTALLAVLAFCFSILGAFLVRSGVLTSVHAFAIDPLRGSILLGGLLAYGGFALGLFAWRAPSLQSGPQWTAFSREGALMLNNLVLATATATVLLGTVFPLIGEAFGEQVSVGEPYFNLTFTPIMALLLATLPVVQNWSWGRLQGPIKPLWFTFAAVLLVGVAVAGQVMRGWPIGALLGVALAVWLLAGAVIELKRRALVWKRVFKLPKRVWGMSLAHAGLGIFVLGAIVETSSGFERTIAVPVGGSQQVAGWTITLDGLEGIEGPNWYADQAQLTATRGNSSVSMQPAKRYYPAARMPTTETAIHKTGFGDLYAALGDYREGAAGGRWTLRVYFNPLVDLVFIGVIMISLGGFLAMIGGSSARRRSDQEASAS
ncbi:MAG: heme lyase CcmF/NrfE family subunit [Pseudomonadota bacterium]